MSETTECPGSEGFVCIGGWLYTQMSNALMIFPTNRKCPVCNHEPTPEPVGTTEYDTSG